MPRREKFSPDQIYHIYNRGVDKRAIFLDEGDYVRFIHCLFAFNDKKNVTNFSFLSKNIDTGYQYFEKRDILVDVFAFALMPNHFHLLLKPKSEEGIREFLSKLTGGYSRHFNQKYTRSGALFEGKYKCVRVANDQHLLHLPYYIHANPLNLEFPQWKEKGLGEDTEKAMNYLEKYRWSSFLDYTGKKNFPSLTDRDFLLKFYGGEEKTTEELERSYKKDFSAWLKDHKSLDLDEFTYPHNS
jgi:putative transposase